MAILRPIAVTLGDPAGIGPEVIEAALHSSTLNKSVPFEIIGKPSSKPGTPSDAGAKQAFEAMTAAAEGLKSGLADMKNTGPRPGGSITAALFLQDFVPKTIPWAHLDIAGTVWSDKGRGLDPAGATGFGVRTLVQWVLANGAA